MDRKRDLEGCRGDTVARVQQDDEQFGCRGLGFELACEGIFCKLLGDRRVRSEVLPAARRQVNKLGAEPLNGPYRGRLCRVGLHEKELCLYDA